MKSDEIFILPAETLRIVRAAEAEWAEASAAFEAARIRRLTTVRDAYAAVIGIAPGSIILASGKARRPVGPMLAVEVDVRRAVRMPQPEQGPRVGDRRFRVAPGDHRRRAPVPR